MKFVQPKVFRVGNTELDQEGILRYLQYTGQEAFAEDISEAITRDKLSTGEVLISFFAKLCYASLTVGKNKNITRTREILQNLIATYEAGHGSVFEHCLLNFVITDCSRVFTHELVRHRAGTAFSQTSGRYVRTDEIGFVHDPILDECKDLIQELVENTERIARKIAERVGLDAPGLDFNRKKKLTSAIRRIAPNGQSNEIGFSVNLRELRHFIQVRTDPHAEWEIRCVAEQIYELTRVKWPTLYYGAKVTLVDGIKHVHGMKLQPYEKQ